MTFVLFDDGVKVTETLNSSLGRVDTVTMVTLYDKSPLTKTSDHLTKQLPKITKYVFMYALSKLVTPLNPGHT